MVHWDDASCEDSNAVVVPATEVGEELDIKAPDANASSNFVRKTGNRKNREEIDDVLMIRETT